MASTTFLCVSSSLWHVSPKDTMAELKTEKKRKTNINNAINNDIINKLNYLSCH
jgi:hypothetical protein